MLHKEKNKNRNIQIRINFIGTQENFFSAAAYQWKLGVAHFGIHTIPSISNPKDLLPKIPESMALFHMPQSIEI